MNRLIQRLIQFFGISQETEAFRWSQSKAYARRIEWIKNTWILSGIVMLIIAHPAFILLFSSFLVFLSFAFLEP